MSIEGGLEVTKGHVVYITYKAVYELAATAANTAESPRHRALKYSMSLATPLETVV